MEFVAFFLDFKIVSRGRRYRRSAAARRHVAPLSRFVLASRARLTDNFHNKIGHLQTRALQKGFAETFAFQRQETSSPVAPTTGETGTVVQQMSGRGAAIPASAVLKASEPFRIGPPSTDLPIEA